MLKRLGYIASAMAVSGLCLFAEDAHADDIASLASTQPAAAEPQSSYPRAEVLKPAVPQIIPEQPHSESEPSPKPAKTIKEPDFYKLFIPQLGPAPEPDSLCSLFNQYDGFLSQSERESQWLKLGKFDDGTGTFRPDAESMWCAYQLAFDSMYRSENPFFDKPFFDAMAGIIQTIRTYAPTLEQVRDAFTQYNLLGGLNNLDIGAKVRNIGSGRDAVGQDISLLSRIPLLRRATFIQIPRSWDGFGNIKLDIDANISSPSLNSVSMTILRIKGRFFDGEFYVFYSIDETGGFKDLDQHYSIYPSGLLFGD